MNNLNQYLDVSEGLDNSRSDELYKWKIISSVLGQSTETIVRKLVTKECNFLERAHIGATLVSLLESTPGKVFEVFDLLRQDKPLDTRIQDFLSAAKEITPKGLTSFGNERSAAAFLSQRIYVGIAVVGRSLMESKSRLISALRKVLFPDPVEPAIKP